MTKTTLIQNIGELVTLEPLATDGRAHHVDSTDLGLVSDTWLIIEDGLIVEIGTSGQTKPERHIEAETTVIDAEGMCVMPGLIDCHTHPIFGGSRHDEFAMRLDGKTYQEIASAGGGIKSTVTCTRSASDRELENAVSRRFKTFLNKGVTTLEAKSGYGLSPEEEIRELLILNRAASKTPQKVVTTCLALHAIPKEATNTREFVSKITEELLPIVAEQKLATYVDAFIESGYFSANDCHEYFETAKNLGLGIRVHADEFTDSQGAATAAEWGAASADHLQHASEDGIQALARQNVVATLLPGTSLYTAIPFTKARPFLDAGCALAVATDYNPGSCLVDNLPMMATVAALHCGLSTAQAIVSVTYAPAISLGLKAKKGAIKIGFDGDVLIANAKSCTEWLADMGRTRPKAVLIGGSLFG